MNLSEERSKTIEQQKSKIRDRYKGDNPDLIKVIPANEEASIFDDSTQLRVAVYARVSTGDLPTVLWPFLRIHQAYLYQMLKNSISSLPSL